MNLKQFITSLVTSISLLGGIQLHADANRATITAKDNEIILQSSGAEYVFAKNAPYHLLRSSYQGKPIFVKNLSFTYYHRKDDWGGDNIGGRFFSNYSMKYEQKKDSATLHCQIKGKEGIYKKSFTLKNNSGILEVQGSMEIFSKNNPINWFNMFSTPVPKQDQWLILLSKEKDGKIQPGLTVCDNPFEDKNGKIKSHGNFDFECIREVFAVGSWNPQHQAGAIVLSTPGKYMWPIRCYLTGKEKRGGMSVSPTSFIKTECGSSLVQGGIQIIPFVGQPSQLNKQIIPEYLQILISRNLIPSQFNTGRLLSRTADGSFWQDLPEAKIFRQTRAPGKKGRQVRLYACRDEGESFQLAFRPKKDFQAVSLKIEGFTEKGIRAIWNPLGYVKRSDFLGYLTAITGDMPDALLKKTSIDCKAGETQPFLVGFRIPRNQKPGVYSGSVTILSREKVLGVVPVKLTVWDFSIEKSTLTAAFDFWQRPKGYDKKKEQVYKESQDFIVDARGGKRWIENMSISFDKNNNLLPVDYSKFDASVEYALKVYRHQFIMVHKYCLGWGMQLRDTWFGPKNSVLTPAWNQRVLNFTRDLKKHMIEKGWNDRVVIDLFDEPKDKDLHVIIDTIKLIKTVAPEWRFTFAGDYREELKGLINFWGHGWSRVSPEKFKQMRELNNELTLYNPNGFSDNESFAYQRGSFIWLWRYNIRYVYQWVTNCWSDLGNTGWDYYRCASWVVPGPDGPEGSMRLEATRNGIEDYEYLSLLRNIADKYGSKDSRGRQARKLIKAGTALAWLPDGGEIAVVANLNPQAYHQWHLQAGKFLNKIK